MPIYKAECEKCGYAKAVCVMAPDSSESFLEARFFCASTENNRVKCGHTWILNRRQQIENRAVVEKALPIGKVEEDF